MNNSSTYVNSFYEAIEAFTKSAVANSNAVQKIDAKIEEIVDAGLGVYSVSYLTNTFNALANPSLKYNVGDIVSILVPEGDFSKDKYIIGTSGSLASQFIENEEDKYYDISDNLINNNILATAQHSLSSYKDTISDEEEVYTESSKDFGQLMKGYIDNYNLFRLDVFIKTSLAKEQQIYGNYGVVLAIPVLVAGNTNAYEYFSIDTTNMIGSPYQFLEWVKQSLIFKINNEYDISRKPVISFFCENFPQDSSKENISDLFFSNLSFKCINKLAEQDLNGLYLTLKASEGEYFVGTYRTYKTLTPTLRLNGKTTTIPASSPIYWFKEDMSVKNDSEYYSRYGGFGWKCLNEKVDVLVDKDGNKTYSYNTTPRTITIDKEDVASATRFKCVVVYDENNVSNIITLQNLESNRFITLSCDNVSNTYIAGGSGNVKLIVNAYANTITDKEDFVNQTFYSFLRYDLNNYPILDDDNFFVCESKNKLVNLDINNDGIVEPIYQSIYSFPLSEIDTLNKVYCVGKYNKDGKTIDIGTASVSISTTDKFKYNIVINNANKIYKYDADGDSPMIEAYDGPAASKVTSISPLTFDVYDEEGNEFGESQYSSCKYSWVVPKNCMITVTEREVTREDDDYYYYEGVGHLSSLSYDIARRYNKSSAMNGIKLIITYGAEIIQSDVPIFFLKDGESGTNGTSYAAILTSGQNESSSYPYGVRNNGDITQKITFVYSIYDNKWYHRTTDGKLKTISTSNVKPKIFTRVYYNGEILDKSNYIVEYEVFDSKLTNPCIEIKSVDSNNGLLVEPIAGTYDSTINTCNIIQAKIVVKNISAMNSDDQILYAYYPIEIVIANSLISLEKEIEYLDEEGQTKEFSMLDQLFPSIDGGFYDVVYASDGTNPSYDETEYFYLDNVSADYYTVSWLAQHHLSQTSIMDDEGNYITSAVKITPDNKYTDGNTLNYVRADLVVNGNSLVADRMSELAALKEEKEVISEKINLLSTKREKLNDFADVWNEQINKLPDIKDLIITRSNVIESLKSILDIIDKNKITISDLEVLNILEELEAEINSMLKDEDFEELPTLSPIGDSDIITILLSDINDKITFYNNKLSLYNEYLSTEEGEANAYIFNHIIISLEGQTLTSFKNYDLQTYKTLISDFSKYYSNSKYNDFIVYFNNIYETDLKAIYDIDEDGIVLSSLMDAEMDKEEEILTAAMDALISKIKDLSLVIGYDHLEITYIRPIVITTNRYEMANFNAWDGNKIYVDDAKSYIMSPQIGAGTKNADNSFTGIVMGGKTTNNQTRYGMFGYHEGEQTLMLSAENGSAIFGKAKSDSGQIVIDPTAHAALLYSSNFFKSTAIDNNTGLPLGAAYNEVKNIINTQGDINQTYVNKSGMIIDLSTPGIAFGSGSFKVTPEGYLVAKAGGSIGGWNIGINELYSQNFKEGTAGVKLSSNGYVALGSADGMVYSGKHSALNSTKDGFHLSGEGLSIGSKFKVSKEGVVEVGKGASTSTGRHWTISATSADSYIKYGERGSSIGEGSVYISTSEICLGNKFRVTSEGVLTLGDGAVKGNSSKHWTINAKRKVGSLDSAPLEAYIAYNRDSFGENSTGYINPDSVYLGTDGIALGKNFSVDSAGTLKANNAEISGKITSKEGNIGGWTIEENRFYRQRKDGDSLMGTMELTYDCLYGYANDKNTGQYHAWQFNANGLAFFSDLYLYNGDGGGRGSKAPGKLYVSNGTIVGPGTISNCTIDSSCSLPLPTVDFIINGTKYRCYGSVIP